MLLTALTEACSLMGSVVCAAESVGLPLPLCVFEREAERKYEFLPTRNGR